MGRRCSTPLKGLSVIDHSKLHFFPNLPIFWYIQRELHCTNLLIHLLSQKHIFGKRDNFLLLGISYCWRWLNQASVSSSKSFKSLFSEVLMYFSIWDCIILIVFDMELLFEEILCVFVDRETCNSLLKFREIFPEEKQ